MSDPVLIDTIFFTIPADFERMNVLVAGSHGQVGQHATRILVESDHDVRGMVRSESQAPDIEDLGAEPVVADLTADVSHAVAGIDAIIFAAGSGGEDVWASIATARSILSTRPKPRASIDS